VSLVVKKSLLARTRGEIHVTIETSGNTNANTPVSRRTVVRGAAAVGATAWTASAITLATATPALAVSSEIQISNFTANYVNHTNANTVNPTQLQVAATFANNGVQPTVNMQFTLTIPANLYATAPTATTPAGWGAPSISAIGGDGLANGWTLVFTRNSQIGAGQSGQPFATTITFTDPGASFGDAPFRRWAGTSFSLAGSGTATNANPAGSSALVAATPNVTFSVSDTNAIWANNAGNNSPLSGPNLRFTASKVYNAGRSSIGKMNLLIQINRPTNSLGLTNYFRNQPNPVATVQNGSRWQQLPGAAGYNFNGGSGPWQFYFETIENGFTPSTAAGGSDALDGPIGPEGIDILIRSASGNSILTGAGMPNPHSLMIISATRANSSQHDDSAWTL
jgi:hypothetical protein